MGKIAHCKCHVSVSHQACLKIWRTGLPGRVKVSHQKDVGGIVRVTDKVSQHGKQGCRHPYEGPQRRMLRNGSWSEKTMNMRSHSELALTPPGSLKLGHVMTMPIKPDLPWPFYVSHLLMHTPAPERLEKTDKCWRGGKWERESKQASLTIFGCQDNSSPNQGNRRETLLLLETEELVITSHWIAWNWDSLLLH